MRVLEVVGMFLMRLFLNSGGIPVECPTGIACGISLV